MQPIFEPCFDLGRFDIMALVTLLPIHFVVFWIELLVLLFNLHLFLMLFVQDLIVKSDVVRVHLNQLRLIQVYLRVNQINIRRLLVDGRGAILLV